MTWVHRPGGLRISVVLPPLQDLLWAASFYARFFLSYVPFYSLSGVLLLFVAVRCGQVWGGRGWGGHTGQEGTLSTAP